MARIEFELHGLADLLQQLDRFEAAVRHEAQALVLDTMLFAEATIAGKISEFDAVDTGRLMGSIFAPLPGDGGEGAKQIANIGQRSIKRKRKFKREAGDSATAMDPGGLGGVVGTNLGYAIPVHEGYVRRLKPTARKPKGNSAAARRLRARLAVQEKGGVAKVKGRQNVLLPQFYASIPDKGTGEPVVALAVQARPFMSDSLPEIREYFLREAERRFGDLPGKL